MDSGLQKRPLSAYLSRSLRHADDYRGVPDCPSGAGPWLARGSWDTTGPGFPFAGFGASHFGLRGRAGYFN
ncbi:hypothetical protein GCM10023172_02970 [Hymenobacter ginsengisoli]|uniref:Uncharacterized protein n=1 Tax=Hymenobacter ginsengisoli TaxID=1051626 RepID=A0ABP8PXH1_9BACT